MFQKGVASDGKEILRDYHMSEKLDGLRAAWDGERFWSRGNHAFPAPDAFKAFMPSALEISKTGTLDGELYLGRGRFQETSSVVRGAGNDWIDWGVRYMVFDSMSTWTFYTRLHLLYDLERSKHLYTRDTYRHFQVVSQWDFATGNWDWDHETLMKHVSNIVALGGEGVMLHKSNSIYRAGRSRDIRKMKLPDYGWARVLKPFDGKGKFTGMIGGYHVTGHRPDSIKKIEFKIGSGLTDWQRQNEIGTAGLVPFRYWGVYKSGIPRQPVFIDIGKVPKGNMP